MYVVTYSIHKIRQYNKMQQIYSWHLLQKVLHGFAYEHQHLVWSRRRARTPTFCSQSDNQTTCGHHRANFLSRYEHPASCSNTRHRCRAAGKQTETIFDLKWVQYLGCFNSHLLKIISININSKFTVCSGECHLVCTWDYTVSNHYIIWKGLTKLCSLNTPVISQLMSIWCLLNPCCLYHLFPLYCISAANSVFHFHEKRLVAAELQRLMCRNFNLSCRYWTATWNTVIDQLRNAKQNLKNWPLS